MSEKRCIVCGGEVTRSSGGYCNQCASCGRVVHQDCVDQIKDIRVAGNLWICDCGARNQIRKC